MHIPHTLSVTLFLTQPSYFILTYRSPIPTPDSTTCQKSTHYSTFWIYSFSTYVVHLIKFLITSQFQPINTFNPILHKKSYAAIVHIFFFSTKLKKCNFTQDTDTCAPCLRLEYSPQISPQI